MTPTMLSTFRSMSTTRLLRVLGAFALVMCSVTWYAQAVTMASGQASTLAALAALQAAETDLSGDADKLCDDESNCETAPIFILDETHDIKLFLLKDLTHWFSGNNRHLPRVDHSADILRRPSETFRPPDRAVGHREHSLAA